MKNIAWEKLAALPTLRARQDRYIRRVVALCGGDLTNAARVLGVGRATLYRRAAKLGIETNGARVERERLERAQRIERALGARGRGRSHAEAAE
jgi:hypothetical protein